MKDGHGSDDWLDLSTRSPGRGTTVMARRAMASRATRIKAQLKEWERAVAAAKPPFSQCQHFIRKFGGIVPFAVAVGVHPSHIVQYWLASPYAAKKSKRGGKPPEEHRSPTGGFIPSALLPHLLVAARHLGILILPEDIYPDFGSDDNCEDKKRWIKSLPKTKQMTEFEHVLASLASTPV